MQTYGAFCCNDRSDAQPGLSAASCDLSLRPELCKDIFHELLEVPALLHFCAGVGGCIARGMPSL